jgi:hypothetical protein
VKTLRAPGQRTRAIEAAVSKATSELEGQSEVWRIKRPDGRIENWGRDLTCRLIAIRHLPASQAPGAISDVLRAIKSHFGDRDRTDCVDPSDVEIFRDRSARWFPLEG